MKYLLCAPLLAIGLSLPCLADTVLPGTEIRVRSDNPIDISRWDRGRIYNAFVARDVFDRDGRVVIQRRSPVELIVRQVGPDRMALDVESVTARGRRYVLDATGPEFHTQDAERNDGGLVGNIIGAIAGAAGAQVQTQGNHIFVPANSVLTFQLQQPLHVVDWGDPGYENGGYHYHHDHDWNR